MAIQAKLEGMGPLLATLDGLKKATQKSIAKKAVGAAGKLVLDAVKPLVPTDTRLLLRSMGRKVVGRRNGALAVVGPRTGFKVMRAEMKTGRSVAAQTIGKTGKIRKIILRRGASRSPVGMNPTQYAHLVESGRKGVRAKGRALAVGGIGFRASVGPAPGVHFMARGLAAARGRVAATMAAVISAGLAGAKR